MPCFGEKIKANVKKIAAVRTIAGPDAQLNVKLRYKPTIDDITEKIAATIII
jgi:hypothetical protein